MSDENFATVSPQSGQLKALIKIPMILNVVGAGMLVSLSDL